MRVVLRGDREARGAGRIEFSDPQWTWYSDGSGHLACTVTVAVGEEERSVGIEQIPVYVTNMVGFFDDMARYASGWSGVMTWESEFHEVEMGVHNPEGNEVVVDFRLRWPPEYEEGWISSVAISADALPRAAEAMRKFTGEQSGRRFITPNKPRTWSPLSRDPAPSRRKL